MGFIAAGTKMFLRRPIKYYVITKVSYKTLDERES